MIGQILTQTAYIVFYQKAFNFSSLNSCDISVEVPERSRADSNMFAQQ